MADFVSGFWNIYVMGLVALSILFCVFILVSNMKGEKGVDGEAKLHGHVWDETLAEYNNPLPRWWMYLFWLTIFLRSSIWSCIRDSATTRGCTAGVRRMARTASTLARWESRRNLWPDLRQVSDAGSESGCS